MVMAGGGFHLGYYLGAYAAMCEADKQPDILLASCGGAIAASLIQSLPNDAERKAWLAAPQMYQYWRSLRAKRDATLLGTFAGAMRRRFFGKSAAVIPDLFNDYMFEIPAQLPLPEATFKPVAAQKSAPSLAIVAGKLNYQESEVGQPRGARKLFSEIVFCEPRAAELIGDMASPLSLPQFGDTAIAAQILTDGSMPLIDAVRASISDMFYFRCHSHASGDYIGGVVDLFPIEVAHRLSDSVIMELKAGYDKMYGQPALRTVLGFDGNARLDHVLEHPADIWFDTADMEDVFLHQRIKQQVIWYKNKIEIVAPPTYDEYARMIDAQWQFGYERGMRALQPQ